MNQEINDTQRGFCNFFSTRLHEALFNYSADSFKATALNTHLRVVELKKIAIQNSNNNFLTKSTDSFFEELDWSIKNDPVLKDGKKQIVKDLTEKIKNDWGKSHIINSTIPALEIQFSDYYQTILSLLIKESSSDKYSKSKIISLLDALIVELELLGYPRSYIYTVAHKISKKIRLERLPKSNDIIGLFLQHFLFKEGEYLIIGYASPILAEAMSKFENWESPIDLSKIIKNQDRNLRIINKSLEKTNNLKPIIFTDKNICANNSSRNFFTVLDRVSERINFIDHHTNIQTLPISLCIDKNTGTSSVIKKNYSPLEFTTKSNPEKLKVSLEAINSLYTNSQLSANSKRRITQALEYHGAAIKSSRHEEQLLNLWSCLEGFVGMPTSTESKINFVRESILSSLNLQYPQRLFNLISNRIKEKISDSNKYLEFIDGKSKNENLAHLLLNKENAKLLSGLGSELAKKDTLLLFRLYELKKRFNDPSTVKNTLDNHREKIGWQINRIYFNRNLITHSAESLPYISTLVEHLHIYVDSFLGSIIDTAKISNAKTISSVLDLFQVHEKIRNKELENYKTKECTVDEISDWVFGKENILKNCVGIY